MIKILTASEMAAADRAMETRLGVPSRVLMESAGREVASFVLKSVDPSCKKRQAVVLTGGGNNGGDGFVVARYLKEAAWNVMVLATVSIESLKGDASSNALVWKNCGGKVLEVNLDSLNDSEVASLLENSGVIIDAIYGTGFRGSMENWPAKLVELTNEISAKNSIQVVSVDIPSGAEASTGRVLGACINATQTVALQCPKIGHVLFPASRYCGKEVYIADIGISNNLSEIASVRRELVTASAVSGLLSEAYRERDEAHKGRRGHVLVMGGSSGHFGAPKMTALAAIACGSGLVTMCLPKSAAREVQTQLLELMCLEAAEDAYLAFGKPDRGWLKNALEGKNAIAIGPGMGQGEGAGDLLEMVFEESLRLEMPLVIDADAINMISLRKGLVGKIPPQSILTPHPGEMARLCGIETAEVEQDRLGNTGDLAARLKCWVILKGARTVVCGPDGEIFINPAASEILATAGSGDVLTGVLAAMLGRGMGLKNACLCAVYVHGECVGELRHKYGGSVGAKAGDIIDYSPRVINRLLHLPPTDNKPFPGNAISVFGD